MSQVDLFAEPLGETEHKISGFSKGDLVAVGTRRYRYHRGCGEFVWLASLDAAIAGPFYWHRADELLRTIGGGHA